MNDEERRRIVRAADRDELVTTIKIVIVCMMIPVFPFACLLLLFLVGV